MRGFEARREARGVRQTTFEVDLNNTTTSGVARWSAPSGSSSGPLIWWSGRRSRKNPISSSALVRLGRCFTPMRSTFPPSMSTGSRRMKYASRLPRTSWGNSTPWNTPRALIAGKALVLSNGAARGLPWAGVVSSMPADALESERLFVDSFTARALRAGRALLIGERTAKLEVGLRQTRRAAQLDRLTESSCWIASSSCWIVGGPALKPQ